jgi:hypothetical protein
MNSAGSGERPLKKSCEDFNGPSVSVILIGGEYIY